MSERKNLRPRRRSDARGAGWAYVDAPPEEAGPRLRHESEIDWRCPRRECGRIAYPPRIVRGESAATTINEFAHEVPLWFLPDRLACPHCNQTLAVPLPISFGPRSAFEAPR